MELLSETTINSTMHRVSTAWLALEHQWEPFISAYTAVRVGLPNTWGGYAKPKWGSRSFSPDLFADDFPPPKTITVKDMLTDSDEASAVTVFEGSLHLDSYNETEITYHAYGEELTTTVDGAYMNDTLTNLFTTYCGVSYLNLTLNTTYARTGSITIDYHVDGEVVLVEELSKIAAWACHAFYIDNGTLYLFDMLTGSGTTQSLDEFGYFMGSDYSAQEPISVYKQEHEDGTKSSLDGSHKYGKELVLDGLDDVPANIAEQMGYVKDIMDGEYYRFRVVPEADKMPSIGQVVTVANESLVADLSVEFVVTDYAVDIARSEILIEGVEKAGEVIPE